MGGHNDRSIDPAVESIEQSSLIPMITGTFASQAIAVAAELGLADLLEDRSRSVEELALATGANAFALARLLRALSALGLFVEFEEEYFACAPLGAQLRTGVPGSLRNYAMFYASETVRRSWGDLSYSVRTGASAFHKNFGANPFDHRASDAERSRLFNDAMADLSRTAGAAAAEACDFSVFGKICDVGGGNGALLSSILMKCPMLEGLVFDLPSGTLGASELLATAGVADRCRVLHGDFFRSVPAGADVYILKSIIHDWDDASSITILRNCASAMRRNGKLFLFEQVLPERVRATPAHRRATLSDLNMLVMTTGKERTESQFAQLLNSSGLEKEELLPTASAFSLIRAKLAN